MSEGDIRAIPTTYGGIEFRSRLEAKWACFFDLICWPWEYEPIDLDGYIPDFVIKADSHPIFVEIKPALSTQELRAMGQKAREATLGKRLLVLGASDRFTDDIEGPTNGLQCVRINLCDESYAQMAINCFGNGKPNCEEWDLDDPSTEQCVIGYWELFQFITCKHCFRVSPIGFGHTQCVWCQSKYIRSRQLPPETNGFRKFWIEATNATKYRHKRA
jgi:hypothetical protein